MQSVAMQRQFALDLHMLCTLRAHCAMRSAVFVTLHAND